MLLENSARIMAALNDSDIVLDIGGWAHPFNRAQYVMDSGPYATRGYYNRTFAKNNPFPPLGGTVEYFTEQTWIQRDICEKTPFPFADKSVDLVICSHTLEDIRDPLWVCHEMIRIGKRGYIEVPSRIWETCRGHEPGIAGLSHHRWLIDIDQARNNINFLPKFHVIHNWRCSLPKSVLSQLGEKASVQWLFWEGSFEYSETTIHGLHNVINELESFVKQVRPYSPLLLQTSDAIQTTAHLFGRIARRLQRVLQPGHRPEKGRATVLSPQECGKLSSRQPADR